MSALGALIFLTENSRFEYEEKSGAWNQVFLIDETTFKLADYLVLSILTCILLVLPLIAESLEADTGYFTSNQFYDPSLSLGFDKTLWGNGMIVFTLQCFLLEFLGDEDIAISEIFFRWLEARKLFFEDELKRIT